MNGKLAIKDSRLNKISASISTSSPSQRFRNDLQNKINSDFDYASDNYTIEQELTVGTLVWSDIDVRITHVLADVTGNKLGDDWRQLIFKQSSDLFGLGHRYKFDDYIWLTVNTDYYKYSTFSNTIRRCNYTLKWYTDAATPELIEEPCIIDYYKFTSSNNVDEDAFIRIGSNIRYAFLQLNNNTNSLNRDDKFIVDRRAYRIIDYDSVTKSGLFIVTLEEYQANNVTDDIVNNIANVNTSTIEAGKLW